MKYDNPAARLLAVLQAGRNIPDGHSCRDTWASLLEAEGDEVLLMSRLSKLMALVSEAVQSLKEISPDQDDDSWRHWATTVNNAFMVQNMHGHWQSFNGSIDNHTLTYLGLSARLLHQHEKNKVATADEITQIRSNLLSLLNETLESECDLTVKTYLVKSFRKIIAALDDYKLTGADGILEEIEVTVGRALRDAPYRHFLFKTDLGQKIRDTLSTAANIATIGPTVPLIANAVVQSLT